MDEERKDEAQAAPDTAPSEDSAWDRLNGKLDSIERQLADIEATAQRNRSAKWVLTLLILIVFCGYAGLIYATAKNFDTYALLEEMEDMGVRLLPQASASLRRAAIAVLPDYQREFAAKAKEAAPILLERLPKEKDTLLSNVQDRVQKRLEEQLADIAEKQEQRLVNTFPRLKDDKKRELVSKHLQHAVQIATAELLYERLEKCSDAIIRVNEAFERFKPDDIRERDRLLKDRLADVIDSFVADPLVPVK